MTEMSNSVKLHSTDGGIMRVRRNLNLPNNVDVVEFCREKLAKAQISRNGKNIYAKCGDCIITINYNSGKIITAHKIKNLHMLTFNTFCTIHEYKITRIFNNANDQNCATRTTEKEKHIRLENIGVTDYARHICHV